MLRTLALLAAVLLVSACNLRQLADSPTGPAALHGEWLSVHPGEAGARTEERMTFREDGSYAGETLWYGHHGRPSAELTGYHRTAGRYQVDGTRLRLRVERSEMWQMFAAGPNPTVTTIAQPQWSDNGTVRVAGDQLTHTYVSAPADAPQEFTQVYRRVRQ